MCTLDISLKLDCGVPRSSWDGKLLASLGLTAAAWVVCLGGLASQQDLMLSNDGQNFSLWFGSTRYYWFIVAWEVVVLAIAAIVVLLGKLNNHRGLVVGLLSVALYLFMQFTDSFLSQQSVGGYPTDLTEKARVNTVIAGAIMTATGTAVSILMVGYDCSEACEAKPVEATKTGTAEVALAVSNTA